MARISGQAVGRVTNAAFSPFLKQGIGMVLMAQAGHVFGDSLEVELRDGSFATATLTEMPLYDKACEIPRGKLVDVPERP